MTYLTKLKEHLTSLDKNELIELIINSDGAKKMIRNKKIIEGYKIEVNNKILGIPQLITNLSEDHGISERQVYRIIGGCLQI